jgi:hypothetical protein
MIKRALKIFPSFKNSKLIYDSKHVKNKAQKEFIENIILR